MGEHIAGIQDLRSGDGIVSHVSTLCLLLGAD